MKLLQELINPNSVNLTNAQMGVLISIKISPTPEVAYESTNGSDKAVYARNSLRTLGLVQVGDNRVVLTQYGEQVLLNYNLVDDTGQMTDRGETEYNQFTGNTSNSGEQAATDTNHKIV